MSRFILIFLCFQLTYILYEKCYRHRESDQRAMIFGATSKRVTPLWRNLPFGARVFELKT